MSDKGQTAERMDRWKEVWVSVVKQLNRFCNATQFNAYIKCIFMKTILSLPHTPLHRMFAFT